jgi:hypothetical protein
MTLSAKTKTTKNRSCSERRFGGPFCNLMRRASAIEGVKIHCVLAMLRQGKIALEDLNQNAKSILFLIEHIPAFHAFFRTPSMPNDATTT